MSRFLREQLTDYTFLGEGRDGGDNGEYNAILFRRDQLRVEESGTFWLSETPSVPGSRSWDAGCVRIATWALLTNIQSSRQVFFLNTHLDNKSQLAREEGAKVIMDFLQRKVIGLPIVLTGDFNATPANKVLEILLAKTEHFHFQDAVATYLQLQPGEMGPATTHGFRGGDHAERRIDYCLATSDLPVLRAEVLTNSPSGRPVSDHFPVEADLQW